MEKENHKTLANINEQLLCFSKYQGNLKTSLLLKLPEGKVYKSHNP
jgi:hypothetical protein